MLEFDSGALAKAVLLRHVGTTEWDIARDACVDVYAIRSAEASQHISVKAYARICNWLGVPMETFFREAATGKEG